MSAEKPDQAKRLQTREIPTALMSVMSRVRLEHPLPSEAVRCSREDLDKLILPLQNLDASEWNRFCQNFSYRKDRLIFLSFCHLHTERDIKRLQDLSRIRCSWTLYELAWENFQAHFPNRDLQMSFAEIYATLRLHPLQYGVAPKYQSADYLPARIDFSLNPDQILSAAAKLLAEHVKAGRSEADTAAKDEAIPRAVEGFLRTYHINPNTSFAASVLGLFLSRQGDAELYPCRGILEGIIDRLPQAIFTELLTHVCNSDRFSEEERAPLFETFYHALERHPNGRELWLGISRRTRKAFMSWHIWDLLRSHYAMNPRKEKAMRNFVRYISDVSELDAQTVMWHFPDFYLIDSWDEMDSSIYVPHELYECYWGSADAMKRPSELPCRSLNEDNYRQAQNGIAKLVFVQPSLDLTLRFLQDQCTKRKSTSTHFIRNA